MIHFNNVLLAVPHVNANDEVVQCAVGLAQQHDARLTLLGVTEDIERNYESWLSTKLPDDLKHEMTRKQQEALSEYADKIRVSHSKVDCVVREGIPFVEMIRQVQEQKADLLVLEAMSGQRHAKRFMGSTTKHVLRKCPCPVMVVHGGSAPTKILAAVDVFVDPDSEAAGLNTQILQSAWELAQQKGARLEVLYAAEALDPQMLSAWGVEVDHVMRGMDEKQRVDFDSVLKQMVQDTIPMTSEIGLNVIEGKPRDVIPDFVKDNDIDLIVMGTVCRTGIKGFLIGNTAEQILSDVNCSILALKPGGFETTVV